MKNTVMAAVCGLAVCAGSTIAGVFEPSGSMHGSSASAAATAPEGLAVDAAAAVEHALRAGDQAPLDAPFVDHDGKRHELRSLLAKGPVVLIFYRGGWCPFCIVSLKQFDERRSAIEAMGATILAVSGELPEHAKNTEEKSELGFSVWTDEALDAGQLFGVAYEFERGKRFLDEYQGEHSERLPLGATYVIAPDGTIAWSYIEENYKKRASPDDVIAALGKIGGCAVGSHGRHRTQR